MDLLCSALGDRHNVCLVSVVLNFQMIIEDVALTDDFVGITWQMKLVYFLRQNRLFFFSGNHSLWITFWTAKGQLGKTPHWWAGISLIEHACAKCPFGKPECHKRFICESLHYYQLAYHKWLWNPLTELLMLVGELLRCKYGNFDPDKFYKMRIVHPTPLTTATITVWCCFPKWLTQKLMVGIPNMFKSLTTKYPGF